MIVVLQDVALDYFLSVLNPLKADKRTNFVMYTGKQCNCSPLQKMDAATFSLQTYVLEVESSKAPTLSWASYITYPLADLLLSPVLQSLTTRYSQDFVTFSNAQL